VNKDEYITACYTRDQFTLSTGGCFDPCLSVYIRHNYVRELSLKFTIGGV